MCLLLQASLEPNPASRRRLTTDHFSNSMPNFCNSISASTLRLTTNDPLGSNAGMRVTHRADITRLSCACSKCSARSTVGDLLLPRAQRSNLMLSHLNFAGGKVLQKYYQISFRVADAVVDPRTVRVGGNRDRIRISSYAQTSQVLDLSLVERREQPWDKIVKINSLMRPDAERNASRFTLTFWATIVMIATIICGFTVMIILTVVEEYRPQGKGSGSGLYPLFSLLSHKQICSNNPIITSTESATRPDSLLIYERWMHQYKGCS